MRSLQRARSTRRRLVLGSVAMAGLVLVPAADAGVGPSTPLSVSVSGANGEGRIETPGRTCADGGDGAYWNYDYSSPLPADAFSGAPADLRLHLALHSDEVRFPNSGPPVVAGPPRAFLQGTDSYATLASSRGTVTLRLQSGSCDEPTLDFDGGSAAGGGTWEVGAGDGAYREATGAGTFELTADVDPGADNPFTLALDGALAVLQPSLQVEVLGTYWGSLGTDYLTRRVTVAYRITNVGDGDAFDATVGSITSPTNGVTPLGGTNLRLGDLAAGDSEIVRVRFQLGLLAPCRVVILGCQFNTVTQVQWSDALDVVSEPTATTSAKAPTLPPPL